MISVIIPVYKAEAYLAYCLESVLGNTYRDLEVICVNDGSPDGSLAILKSFAARDNRVRIISQANAGVATARNTGIDAATGDWLAFIDADDAVHYRYFERLLEAWEQDGYRADAVVCHSLWHEEGELPDFREEWQANNVSFPVPWTRIRTNMLAWAFMCGKIYRREFIGQHRLSPELSFSEDTYFNLAVLSSKEDLRLVAASEARYYYRVNKKSAYFTHSFESKIRAYSKLQADCRAWPSRFGRIVSSELVAKNIYSDINGKHNDREGRASARAVYRRTLYFWASQGFISASNFIHFLKYTLYYFFPCLSRIGLLIHRLRH